MPTVERRPDPDGAAAYALSADDLKGIEAIVRKTPDGYSVAVFGNDSEAAKAEVSTWNPQSWESADALALRALDRLRYEREVAAAAVKPERRLMDAFLSRVKGA